jgi:hypothetical protein
MDSYAEAAVYDVAEDSTAEAFFSSETIALLDYELEAAIGVFDETSCTKYCC